MSLAPSALRPGDTVVHGRFGVGRILATPEAPGSLPPSQLGALVFVAFNEFQRLHEPDDLQRAIPYSSALQGLHPKLKPFAMSDPALVPALRKGSAPGAVDDYLTPNQLAHLNDRYVPRFSADEAMNAREYGEFLGKSAAWVKDRIRRGLLAPSQTVVTVRGTEDHLFQCERGERYLSSPQLEALRVSLVASRFGVTALGLKSGVDRSTVGAILDGAGTTQKTCARLLCAVQELREEGAPRTVRISRSLFVALKRRIRAALAEGHSLRRICDASDGIDSAHALLHHSKTCTTHTWARLQRGLDRLDQARLPHGPMAFREADLEVLGAALAALPDHSDSLLTPSLNQAVASAIAHARLSGYRTGRLVSACAVSAHVLDADYPQMRSLGTGRRIVEGLLKALREGRDPDLDALRAQMVASRYTPARIAHFAKLDSNTVLQILQGAGAIPHTRKAIRDALVVMADANELQTAPVSPSEAQVLFERLQAARAAGWRDRAIAAAGKVAPNSVEDCKEAPLRWEFHVWKRLLEGLTVLERAAKPFEAPPSLDVTGIRAIEERLVLLKNLPNTTLPTVLQEAVAHLVERALKRYPAVQMARVSHLSDKAFRVGPNPSRTLETTRGMVRGWKVLMRAGEDKPLRAASRES